MRLEMQALGKEVDFVSVNAVSALEQQEKLINRCSFPLLQDQEDVDVWGLMDGKKDDFYVYDSQGVLAHFLPIGGDISVNLTEDEGYNNLKSAILSTE
ncbi:MAG TPA: hypothetical protein EYN06_02420 [Myxococcales bacterium]|nr:hypothetical protein [Myxococcales bacterium]